MILPGMGSEPSESSDMLTARHTPRRPGPQRAARQAAAGAQCRSGVTTPRAASRAAGGAGRKSLGTTDSSERGLGQKRTRAFLVRFSRACSARAQAESLRVLMARKRAAGETRKTDAARLCRQLRRRAKRQDSGGAGLCPDGAAAGRNRGPAPPATGNNGRRRLCVRACVHCAYWLMGARASASARVRACMRACLRTWADVSMCLCMFVCAGVQNRVRASCVCARVCSRLRP